MGDKSKKIGTVFQIGQQVGQYRIIGTPDQGRFADKYLVQHIHNGTSMMLQVFQPPLVNELKANFLVQAQTLMKLNHPHILRLQDAGVENYYPFLVTDLTPHSLLQEVYAQGSRQSLTMFLPYLKQIASALQYAHDQKILHGDVRPANILLDRHKAILLQGFTIEALTENRARLNYQQTEVMRKTIAYTAPEQIQGKASPASDQYSLAIIVYELLCGEAPFTGSYVEVAHQHVHTPPPSLQQKVPGISKGTENIVMNALAKNPARRFPTIQAFINALEQEHDVVAQFTASAAMGHNISPPLSPVAQIHLPTDNALRSSFAQSDGKEVMIAPVVAAMAPQRPSPVAFQSQKSQIPPMPLSPPITPSIADSPLAPRRNNTMTRRAFAVGLVGLAAFGGAGGWYMLSKRLTQPALPSLTPNGVPAATSTVVNNTKALIFTGHLAAVNSLTWSPDGKLIASASDDKFVQVFDATSGVRKVIYSGHAEEVAAVAWSPNGKLIASGSQDKTVQVWDAASGKKLFTYQGHNDRVNSVAWSNDSLLLTSGSEDKTVQVWNAANGTLDFNFLGHSAGVLCVGWQPDNSSLASGSWDGTLRDWATVQHGDHFNAGDQIFSYGGHGKNEVYALAWSPDGNFIASAGADQTVQISNGSNGTPRLPFFIGHQSKTRVNPVRSVAWSPDGNFMASGDTQGNVLVWQIAGRKTIFSYSGHKGAVNAVAWSPDGKRIASASVDNTVQIWQLS